MVGALQTATDTTAIVNVASRNPSKHRLSKRPGVVKEKKEPSPNGAQSVRGKVLRERVQAIKGALLDEVPRVVVEKFRALYVHNYTFGLQQTDGACPIMPRLLKGNDGDRQIREHLANRQSLVVYPAFERGKDKAKFTRYGMWDVDFKVVTPNQQVEAERGAFVLRECRRVLSDLGIDTGAAYCYLTGKKGCRIALHFSHPLSVAAWTRLFEAVLWHGDEGQRLADLPDVKFECRPTLGGMGVRPPLSIHQVTGNPCLFIDPTTEEPYSDQFGFLLSIRTVDTSSVFEALQRAPKHYQIKERKRRTSKAAAQQGAPMAAVLTRTELDALLHGYLPSRGLRHIYLWQLAALLCERGIPQEEAQAELERWTMRQANHGVADSDPATWADDLRSTVERAYSGQVRLPATVQRAAPAVTDAEVRRLIAPLKKKSAQQVMGIVLWHAKQYADEAGEFYMGVRQITKALFPEDGFTDVEEYAQLVEYRKGDVNKALRELVKGGYLVKVRDFHRQERLATVYRLPEVKESPRTAFPLSCDKHSPCKSCASVMLVQTLTDAELKALLSRCTYKRVKEEAGQALCCNFAKT